MQHYDGPAFYRMQKAKGRIKQHIKRSTKEQVYENEVEKHKAINNDKTKLKWRESGRTFRPTYVPPPILKLHKLTSEQAKYDHLFVQLKKEKESFFLFEGESEAYKTNVIILEDEHSKSKNTSLAQHTKLEKKSSADGDSTQVVFEKNDDVLDALATEDKMQMQSVNLLEDKSDSTEIKEEKINDETQDEPCTAESANVPTENIIEEQELVDSSSGQLLPIASRDDERVSEKALKSNSETKPEIIHVSENNREDSEVHQERMILPETKNFSVEKDNETKKAYPIEVESSIDKTSQVSSEVQNESKEYRYPPVSLLPAPIKNEDESMDEWVLDQIDVLNETLKSFNVKANVKDWTIGPAVTQFEIVLGRGVKVNKITNLSDDLKLALAARDIRIEAPIPGKSSVGVEIPNLHSRPVMLSEVLTSDAFIKKTSPLTVALGVDLFGRPKVTDLRKMPHGLIAGATGSGKSVFINSILVSLLYKATPAQVKLLLIDPKAVELAPYHDIPHLLSPVVSDPAAAAAALKWAVEEMEERYQRLAAGGARNIEGYNAKAEKHGDYGLKMPYIIIIIDELADLMMVASSEVQDYIARITQKARAAGIHLIIATQRPSVDVITGTIKNNIPTRVAFMVSSQVDSRTILDCSGAERLLGRGDMLYLGNGKSQPTRIQGTFVENEIDQIADFVRTQGKPKYAFDPASLKKKIERSDQEDDLLPNVLAYIVNEESISTSKLQRVFSIGYNRAANIIDDLEQKRYISPARGSKPRDVFLTQAGLDKLKD